MTETVNRKLPFWLKTCGRISRKNILFRKICNRLPFNPSKKVRGNNYSDVVGVGNYPMELQLDDHIDATIWWHGNYEPVESGLFSKVVKPRYRPRSRREHRILHPSRSLAGRRRRPHFQIRAGLHDIRKT